MNNSLKHRGQIIGALILGAFAGILVGIGFLVFFLTPIPEGRIFTVITLSVCMLFGISVTYIILIVNLLKEYRKHLKEAEDVNQVRGKFISMILHHLRTPLTGMKWALESIREKEPQNSSLYGTLIMLEEENSRAINAVNHLMEVSRASAGSVEYRFELIPLSQFMQSIQGGIENMRELIVRKPLDLKMNLQSPSQNLVRVDTEKMITVVQTLLENSVKYTPSPGSIIINNKEQDGQFIFEITDTGIGIEDKDKDYIFTQFFRGQNARAIAQESFGIGLALINVFIKEHGGEIWFTSVVGKGTTFSFRLPIYFALKNK